MHSSETFLAKVHLYILVLRPLDEWGGCHLSDHTENGMKNPEQCF